MGRPDEVSVAFVTPPPPPTPAGRNDALADLPTLRLSVQVSFLAEATQASPQPANVFPAAALAVSVTVRPAVYFWMQVFVDAVPMHFPPTWGPSPCR